MHACPAISSILLGESFHRLFIASCLFGSAALNITLFFIKVGVETPQSILPKSNSKIIKNCKELLTKDFCLILFTRINVTYLMGAVQAYLPLFAVQKLGFLEADIPLLFTTYAVFNLIARPIAGRFTIKAGERSMLRLGIILATVASGLFALSSNLNLIWLAISFQGFSHGLFLQQASRISGNVFQKKIEQYA